MTFSHPCLIGQTNRHLYKIAQYKNTASNLLLDHIEKEALRCNKKERFLHGRFWSRARQRDVLRDRISFERLKNYAPISVNPVRGGGGGGGECGQWVRI